MEEDKMAKDPVCGMFVEEGPNSLKAEVRGSTYYFCSEGCLSTFLKPEVELKSIRLMTIFSFSLGIPIFVFSMGGLMGLPTFLEERYLNLILFVLATPVQLIAGRRFYSGFLHALKAKAANMDTLIAVGTTAAWGYSTLVTFFPQSVPLEARSVYFETSTLIIGFILLGRLLEHKMRRRASDAIRKLMALQPKTATVIKGAELMVVPVEEIKVGDLLLVKPGESVPTDGVVEEGYSSVDEKMITGESIPVEKKVGDEVIGSTINKSGVLKIRATRVGADTTLSQIVKLVEEASAAKAPIERLADRVSSYFVPAVVSIAVASFAVWLLLASNFSQAFTALVAVLIIACPCALGLATPAAIVVGTGRGAEKGILIKGGEYLERANNLDTVIFDKTGTLTKGILTVTDVVAYGMDLKDVLRIAAAAEKNSEHPIAEAIIKKAEEMGIILEEPRRFEALSGLGVKAQLNDGEVLVGNRRLMIEGSVPLNGVEETVEHLTNEGKTVLYAALSGRLIGIIAVADVLKEGAKSAVEELKRLGLKVIILTGDHKVTAEAVAREIGVEEVLAEVLPADKASVIKKMQEEGKCVAMVGDGVNDAPALAQADVGIAIGSGTDVAVEAGGVVLIKDDPRDVAEAIKLSRKTMKKIRQNLFWAFAYNTAFIPIAASGLLNPIFAAVAMAMSSVSVVANSLTLKRE
ncbi:MAG: heavy metal translocating P-type ATPase [Nitrososphaerales archaeon]